MKDELIALALELENAAQFDNSSSGVRDTCDEVADKLRKLAQTMHQSTYESTDKKRRVDVTWIISDVEKAGKE